MEILSTRRVKTRKPHYCPGCDKVYPAGMMMDKCAIADGGSVRNTYWCLACQTVLYETPDVDSGDYFDGNEFFGLDGSIRLDHPEVWKRAYVDTMLETSSHAGT
jgi:hypothetical protein